MTGTSVWDTLSGAKWIVIWGLLGAYGAVEAFLRVLRGGPRLYQWFLYHWRNRHLAKDFYYKYREAAYRVSADRRSYLYVRRETVVAMKDVAEIPISYRWTGEGETEVTIAPESFSLVDAARIKGDTRTRKLIRPNAQLRKGQTAEYVFTVKCAVKGKEPEAFLGSSSSHRVDDLLLRAIFSLSHMPAHVWYVIQNPDGMEVARTSIEKFDPITGEYSVEIKRPDAHLIYIVEWE
jgi:hypothetical protein